MPLDVTEVVVGLVKFELEFAEDRAVDDDLILFTVGVMAGAGPIVSSP